MAENHDDDLAERNRNVVGTVARDDESTQTRSQSSGSTRNIHDAMGHRQSPQVLYRSALTNAREVVLRSPPDLPIL
jgi:hypothetical protein